jgi:hypothetical protein
MTKSAIAASATRRTAPVMRPSIGNTAMAPASRSIVDLTGGAWLVIWRLPLQAERDRGIRGPLPGFAHRGLT